MTLFYIRVLSPEMKWMQKRAREHAHKVMEETEKLQHEINTRSIELNRWCEQLIEKETSTIHERRKFEEEKKRVNLFN